jgi:hypothetical protein
MPVVPTYAGQAQTALINGPATPDSEDGPCVVPPYAQMFPPQTLDWVPPRLVKTDLWSAQQTYPL